MTDAAQFIDAAIERGQKEGLAALRGVERLVFVVSELEVDCTMDGIDSFVDRHGASGVREAAEAFRTLGAEQLSKSLLDLAGSLGEERLLSACNDLVVGHVGWDYDALHAAVARLLAESSNVGS